MTIVFEISLGAQIITETDLAKRFAKLRPELAAADSMEGGVSVTDDEGDETVGFGDVLEALVEQLCFRAVTAVLAGKDYSFNFYAYPEQVTLHPEGALVHLSGSDIEPVSLPAAELLPGLVACGERFVTLLERIHQGNAKLAKHLASLRKLAAETQAKVSG